MLPLLSQAKFGDAKVLHVGGEFSYESSTSQVIEPEKGDEDETTALTFQPTIGYFVIPGLEVGLAFGYNTETSTPERGDSVERSGLFAGPFVAYFHPVSPDFLVFGRGSYQQLLSYEDDTLSSSIEVSGSAFTVGGGLAAALGGERGAVVSLGVDYRSLGLTLDLDSGSDVEMETAGLQLSVGFSVYFGM